MLNDQKPSGVADDQNKSLSVHDAPNENTPSDAVPTAKKSKLHKFHLTKKQKVIATALTVLLIIGTVAFIILKPDKQADSTQPAVEDTPQAKTIETSRLTGLEVGPEVNQRTVTGIMIENSPDARPQAGLKEAGVVYEAVAEGGITRFLALFQDIVPEYVGPVRSVRPYYLDFLGPYDAGIAHVGGSGQALGEIKAQNIKDLDQFSNPGPYWRENTRFAPHNMFTNVGKLKELEKQKGWTASAYQGLVRGGSSTPANPVTAKTINVSMSSALYAVHYDYDAASNTYKRSEGGKPHMDAKSNTQLAPTVVVVPIIPRSQSGIYSVYATTAGGKVLVFQNGSVSEGAWKKSDRKGQFIFTGTDGQPLKLAPGQTWVTVAASPGDIQYAP